MLLGWVAWCFDGPPRDLVAMVVLGLLLIASWFVRVQVLNKVSVAAGSIILLAALVIIGPLGSAIINAVAMFVEVSGRQLRVRIFNAAMTGIVGAVGGLTYLWAGGARDVTALDGPGEILLFVGLPMMVADVVLTLVNVALIAGIVWVDGAQSFRRSFVSMLTTSGLAQIGYGVIGFLFVILWLPAKVGPVSALFILIPLFVARWAFVQYGEEQRAHERTLTALVAAAEARDPYAVGHSERVARLAEWVGEELGLRQPHMTALRYAAILHDVGLIGLGPSRRPDESPWPNASERAHLATHPPHGAALLEGIDFLADSFDAIRHHHERVDGLGYPDRLVGDDIPLLARIVAVCDAFDAVTVTRPGQEGMTAASALEALRARVGTHLDGEVLASLGRALERNPWTGVTIAATGTPHDAVLDHDHPQVSDLMARAAVGGDGAR